MYIPIMFNTSRFSWIKRQNEIGIWVYHFDNFTNDIIELFFQEIITSTFTYIYDVRHLQLYPTQPLWFIYIIVFCISIRLCFKRVCNYLAYCWSFFKWFQFQIICSIFLIMLIENKPSVSMVSNLIWFNNIFSKILPIIQKNKICIYA